jgi:tetratricopeptide (TPR) repeat protein
MRALYSSVFLSILATVVLTAFTFKLVFMGYKYPYPAINISPMSEYVLTDMVGTLFGSRRLAADIAWIQLLQYYSGENESISNEARYRVSWDMVKHMLGMKVEEKDVPEITALAQGAGLNRDVGFQKLYPLSKRIVGLDPFFTYAYLYGAGALAWNENRPDEAIKLLEDGIKSMELYRNNITSDFHSPYWQFHLYMGAIIYSKEGRFEDMISDLERAVTQQNCPNLVRAVLASIYEQRKQYAGALGLWTKIYETGDPMYQDKSSRKIIELTARLGA